MVKAGHTMAWSKTPTCIMMTPDGHRVEMKFFYGTLILAVHVWASTTHLKQRLRSKTLGLE